MPNPRERRKKILDWEELESAPNTNGAFSFLMSAAAIVRTRANEGAVIIEEPLVAAADLELDVVGNRDTVVYNDTVPFPTTVPETDIVPHSTIVFDPSTEPSPDDEATPVRRKRDMSPLRCRLVQDAHTLGETVLYQLLWSNAKPESPETRIITLGWKQMAALRKGMKDKFCKHNVAGLISKLAMEMIRAEDIHRRIGRTYRIHSFTNILARRKAAGYEWVSRDKTRKFVQPDGTSFDQSSQVKEVESDTDTVSLSATSNTDTVVYKTPGTVVYNDIGTVVYNTPPLGTTLEIREKVIPTTTTEVEQIVEVLASEAGVADADAAKRLISACRNACPTATVAEMVGVVEEKALAARSRRDVRNPIGFLLSTVPLVFDGPGIATYRKRIAAAAEAARAREEHERRERERWNAELTQDLEHLRVELAAPGTPSAKVLELQKRISEYEGFLNLR